MPRAERIAGWAGARFFFPPPPLFFSRPLFIPSSAPPPAFRWMLRVGPSTGDAIRGAARQGSSDGKTPSADHRSVPTSWRKSSARQSGCLCKPTTQINAANQAALDQGHAALAIHNRFAAAAGVTQRQAACLERPCFPTLSDNAWARCGRRLESRRRRRGIRRGEEGRKRLRSAKPPKPPKPIRADENETVGLTLIAGSERFRKTFAFGRWMRETDKMRAFRLSARRRKSYTLFSVFITIAA